MSKIFKVTLASMFAFAFAVTASAATVSLTSNLSQGSTGDSVKALQVFLNSCPDTALAVTAGATGSAGNEGTYFGAMTKSAVMKYQTKVGVSSIGIVGPMTRAAMSSTGNMCGTGSTGSTGSSNGCPAGALFNPQTGAACTTTTVSTLSGTAGEIADVDQLSQYSNIEVGANTKDVKVLGVTIKASKEGDIGLKSAKVSFVLSNSSGSVKIADYVSTVSAWLGSTKVGSANAADFTKDSTGHYSKTVALDSSAVIKADKSQALVFTVDAPSLDSGDIDSETVTMGLDNVRFVDGAGVVTTEDQTGDLPVSGVSVKFVDFSTSADTELKISANATPEAGVVKVSSTADTKGVVLLQGKLKLDGTSKVWLDQMPITFVTTGDSIDALTSLVTLNIGGNSYTESTGGNCNPTCTSNTTSVITFDNLNLDLAAGSTTNFTVTADINDIENTGLAATDFDESDTLSASLLTTDRDDIVAENAQGDQLVDGTEMTGSVTGNAQTFRSTGINVALVGTPTATVQAGDAQASVSDSGTFTITVDVTAFGGDMWIDKTNPTASGGSTESDLDVTGTGTLSATIQNVTGATAPETAGTNAFVVRDGTTQRFLITAHVLATASGYFNVALADLLYATTDVDGDTQYTTGLTAFKTGNVYLADY